MVKISNVSYENEIHRVDSPFNDDSKNIIFLAREALISGRDGRKIREMAKNRETYCYVNLGVVNSNREYWPLLFALLLFSRMFDQIIC